jgi:hypothetical protein
LWNIARRPIAGKKNAATGETAAGTGMMTAGMMTAAIVATVVNGRTALGDRRSRGQVRLASDADFQDAGWLGRRMTVSR